VPGQIRVEYPGAIYHVMSRGDRREAIVHGDADRELWIKTLMEACANCDWQVHGYCLKMIRHQGRKTIILRTDPFCSTNHRSLAANGYTWGNSLVRWSDEGNRNQHEARVKSKKNGKEYNALTDAEFNVTVDGHQVVVHNIVNVRYSDNVGPHNKEKQKLEPAHGNEIDRDFKMDRAPKILNTLTRYGGPLEGEKGSVLKIDIESEAK
jgi:hypothetical protein